MKVTVYCENPASAAYNKMIGNLFADAETELLPASGCGRTIKTITAGTFVYFDTAALTEKKILEYALKVPGAWGVIDKSGSINDPALFFYKGACDYLGPLFFKNKLAISGARLRQMEYYIRVRECGLKHDILENTGDSDVVRTPAFVFPGWNNLKTGKQYPFVFLYAALGGQRSMQKNMGEKRINLLREAFSQYLETWTAEVGGKVWIKDAASNLILFPPDEAKNSLIVNLLRFQLNRALIGFENLKMDFPLTFRFAVHEGTCPWQKPGSTGTVVSEDINFIYHFGIKSASDGTICLADKAINLVPKGFSSFFKDGPLFENRKTWHSPVFL